EPALADAPDDRDELLAPPESRVSARHLYAHSGAVRAADGVDPLEHDLEGHVLDRLGALREVAEGAIEVAALRDLERHAADGRAAPEPRVRRPETRVEPFPRRRERTLALLPLRGCERVERAVHLSVETVKRGPEFRPTLRHWAAVRPRRGS